MGPTWTPAWRRVPRRSPEGAHSLRGRGGIVQHGGGAGGASPSRPWPPALSLPGWLLDQFPRRIRLTYRRDLTGCSARQCRAISHVDLFPPTPACASLRQPPTAPPGRKTRGRENRLIHHSIHPLSHFARFRHGRALPLCPCEPGPSYRRASRLERSLCSRRHV